MNSVSSAEKSILPKKSPFGNCCWEYICQEKFDSVALRSHLTACFNSDNVKETKTDGIAARDYNGNIVFNVEEPLILRTDDEKMNDNPENELKKKNRSRRARKVRLPREREADAAGIDFFSRIYFLNSGRTLGFFSGTLPHP